MSTIVFIVYPAESHHNATFKLARRLRENGNRVVYVVHEQFAGLIAAQDFEFYVLKRRVLPSPFKTHLRHKELKPLFIADFREGTFYDEMVADLRPDLILLDYPLLPYAVFLQRCGAQIIALQTMVCLRKDRLIPPVNRMIVPNNSWWSHLKVEASWAAYFVTRFLSDRQQEYLYGASETSLLRKAVDESPHFAAGDIDTGVYLHYGLKNYPQLVFSPREFDFPRPDRPDTHYIGPVVDEARRDVLVPKYGKNITDILHRLAEKKKKDPSHQVVFCSLGVNNHLHYDQCPAFFQKIIAVFEARPDVDLVLAVGVNTPTEHFTVNAPNIHLFGAVPQLAVLPLASLMITHGGMNSLTECLYFGVPVVVYALSLDIDQRGNGARAVYHGLGVQGDIRRDGVRQIARRVDEVLGNPAYRRRTAEMGQRVKNSPDFERGVRFIESKLTKDKNPLQFTHVISESGHPE